MRRAANSCRIEMRLPGSSARWYTTSVVLSWPVGRGHAVAGDDARSGSGCRRGRRCRAASTSSPYSCAGDPRRDGRQPGARLLADVPRRLGGRVGGPQLGARAAARTRKRWHCAVATGIDSTALTSASVVPGRAEQALLDVEHDLALDEQVVVEDQRVLREVDGALDRVLDGDEADVDLAVGRRPRSTSGIVRQRHQLGRAPGRAG